MTADARARGRRSPWARARALAERTPPARNRYVDLLRAVSIGAVILGHWTMAAPHFTGGTLEPESMLAVAPWTRWVTWVFQVMPVFFMVGGFSNGISWSAARRDGRGYAEWLGSRLRRLIGPVMPLLVLWALLGVAGNFLGVTPEVVRVGSQMALIPTWFLAVYVMVVLLVPLSHAAWGRFGLYSFWALAAAAAVIDLLFFAADVRWPGWANYFFVWVAVHQLGYAWRDGRPRNAARALLMAAAGGAALAAMVAFGPYPVSMVGVPGDEVSNTLPPKLTMLALGVLQGGLLLSLQQPARRWLERGVPWTATVLVNGMIMTIFLWHLTVMTLLVGLLWQLDGLGLTVEPGSGLWYATRPVWLVVLAALLTACVSLVSRFESPRTRDDARPPVAWRLIAGSVLVGLGLALIALDGIGGEGFLGLRVWVVALPFAGAGLMGLGLLRGVFAR